MIMVMTSVPRGLDLVDVCFEELEYDGGGGDDDEDR